MPKGTFVNLAQKYKPGTKIGGFFMSEKLEGVRAIWDGGITRGMAVKEVPWANLTKDKAKKMRQISSGLWSRYGNKIHAPDWFLDQLPNMILDGELYLGRGMQQTTNSVVLSESGERWEAVTFRVFAALTLLQFLRPDATPWGWNHTLLPQAHILEPRFTRAPHMIEWLQNQQFSGVVQVIPQVQLPSGNKEAEDNMFGTLEQVISNGGEGLVLRDYFSSWEPYRSRGLLKVKPKDDSEGTVVGYRWAKEGKIAGMLGSLRVAWESKVFDLSGFTDEERTLVYDTDKVKPAPGEQIGPDAVSLHFPIGSKVTFMYRGLTEHGMPVEARYLRRRENA